MSDGILDDIADLLRRGPALDPDVRAVLLQAADTIRDLRQAPAFGSRLTDPTTSDVAADKVADREGPEHIVRDGTHKASLLVAYGRASRATGAGRFLTDADACAEARITTGGWKRCSDLRAGGFIAPAGEAPGPAGVPVMVCGITDKGLARWAELDIAAPREPGPAPVPDSLF